MADCSELLVGVLWRPVHAGFELGLSCIVVLQTRLTALDLIGYAAGDERSRQFVHMPEAELEQELLSIKASSHLHCLLLMCICLGAILYLSLAVVAGLAEPFSKSLHLGFPAECSCCKGSNSIQQIHQHVT